MALPTVGNEEQLSAVKYFDVSSSLFAIYWFISAKILQHRLQLYLLSLNRVFTYLKLSEFIVEMFSRYATASAELSEHHYHPRIRRGNTLGRICLSVMLGN